ncbi:unnamed protein product [Effrenium voratum]|uniref:Protein kinase domain-containing protein n=1 Tax=Effrenium voratum TaxID=2562239 RepID=A0AA36N284_9DINO|nr:unnamed protein product [Effrenium voratum]
MTRPLRASSIDVLLAIQNGMKLPDDESAKSDAASDVGEDRPGSAVQDVDCEWAESSTDWGDFATRSFDPRSLELPSNVRRRSSRGELMRKIDFNSCFATIISYSKDDSGKPGLDMETESLFIIYELGMESLEDRLIRYAEQQRQLSAEEHCRLQWALVSIVFGLHTLGYVHLDIKPANIVCFALQQEEQWKLIDLDGALCTGKSVRLDSVVATLHYLSPELASTFLTMKAPARDRFGRPHRTKDAVREEPVKLSRLMDVWSVGMCAMEAIFGVPILKPWYDEWFEETGEDDKFLAWLADFSTDHIITGDMRDALREIDSDMCSLLEGMLHKDPEKRFSIIECVNHTWFQKIRTSHLEDLAGIVEVEEEKSPLSKSQRSPQGLMPETPKGDQGTGSRACAVM